MSEPAVSQLKILVEQAVRPVRASTSEKQKMREELLSHVTSVFEEEVARLADGPAALARTSQRLGEPAKLAKELQASVPALDWVQRIGEWVAFRPGESTLRRAARYTLLFEGAALLFLGAMWALVRGLQGVWPTEALWHNAVVLFLSGYLGLAVSMFESSMRRWLLERQQGAWLSLALALLFSTFVSLTLGPWAYGFSPNKLFFVFVFTVGLPVGLAWILAHDFTARQRYHEDWSSVKIE